MPDNPFTAEIERRNIDPRDQPGLQPIEQPTGLFQRELERRGLAPSPAVPLNDTIDQRRGAPAAVRGAVGAAQTPRDRLATLRQFFPDAQPYLGDNFIFTDPETNRPTLYNPPGLDLGDAASILPEAGEAAGGAAGGALAAGPAIAAAPGTFGASLAAIPAGVGLGASAGREAVTLSSSTLGSTIDTRETPQRLLDAAATAAGNAVGQRVGDLIGRGVGSVFGPVLRRPFSSTTTRQLTADFQNAGVRPLAGAVTGNRGTQLVEQALANTPGGASVVQRAATEAVEGLARASDDLAARYARGGLDDLLSAEGIGEAIQRGAGRASERFTNRQTALYDGVYSQIPGNSPAQLTAIPALRRSLARSLERAPEALRNQLAPALRDLDALFADAAQAGGIPFQALREVRTALGKRIGDPLLVGENSAQRQYLQQVYAALTRDMNSHAAATSPGAIRDLLRADRYTRRQLTQNIPIINRVLDAGTPEQVFRATFGGPTSPGQAIQLGGSAIRNMRRNMLPEEWDAVSGSMLRRMGLARPAAQADTAIDEAAQVFSPQTFMTRWNQLSPEARLSLFGGTRYGELIPELNSLSRVANALSQSEKLGNPSGTARAFLVGGTLSLVGERVISGQPGQAAAVLGGSLVAPNVAARLITNRSFVRWLTGTMRDVASGSPTMTGRIGRLTAIAEANPEIREEIGQYLDALRVAEASLQSPARTVAPTDTTPAGPTVP